MCGFAHETPTQEAEAFSVYQISKECHTPVWELAGCRWGPYWQNRIRIWMHAESKAEAFIAERAAKG